MGIGYILKKAYYKKNTETAKSEIESLPKTAVDPDCYSIIEEPQLFKKRILELIRSSKKRICMTALYFQNDEAGQEIMNALYEAKTSNPAIEIYVYVDFHRAQRGLIGKGLQEGNNVWYQKMASAHQSQPVIYGVPVKKREIFGVLHLKGFVFDDTVLYSGASINNVYLGENGKYRIDRYHEIRSKTLADAMCSYCNTVFNHSQAIFNLNKSNVPAARDISVEIKAQKNILRHEEYRIPNEEIAENQIGVTPLVGLGKRKNRLNHTILYLLESAVSEITVYTPYFNLPAPIRKRISRCLKKGVRVTLVCGDKTANDFYISNMEEFNKVGAIPYIYEINLRKFISKNQSFIDSGLLEIHLWKDGSNTYHVKGMTIDGRYTLLTGNNLNPRAWGLDLENGLLINDPGSLLLSKFTHEKEYLLKHTSLIRSINDLEDMDSYPEPVRKIISKVNKLGAQWLLKKLL